MKVFALVILVVGSTSGLGSGPYLPSGWRPSGPAFYLPTEVEKPVAIPLKDVPVQESAGSSFIREYGPPADVEVESSGSDALREYGPPKVQEGGEVIQEVSQDFTQQALPEPITEQAFVVIEAQLSQEEGNAAAVQQVVSGKVVEEVTATGFETAEQATESLIQGKSLDVESQTESSLAYEEQNAAEITEQSADVTEQVAEVTEQAAELTDQAADVTAPSAEVTEQSTELTEGTERSVVSEAENIQSIVAAVEQRLEEEAIEVQAVEEGVKNIAEALVNLENEIIAQQVQEAVEAKTVQESSGSVQSPQGSLEYGPPGFTEYGPPKGALRTLDAAEETNEIRRRRFSPKFRSSKRKH